MCPGKGFAGEGDPLPQETKDHTAEEPGGHAESGQNGGSRGHFSSLGVGEVRPGSE